MLACRLLNFSRRSFALNARSIPTWLTASLLICIAFLPRVTQLDDFYTTDEAYFWQHRVARFDAALQMHDWAATNQTGHPGVTTMWLGALGRHLAAVGGAPEPAPGAGATHLAYLRLPLAVANALAVGMGYLLLLRLVRPGTAFLAGVLWALAPFLIAHSRLLHLDALLTSLSALSLLLLLVATRPSTQQLIAWPALGGAAVCAGLALLTKAPALIMLPMTALVLLDAVWRATPTEAHPFSRERLLTIVRQTSAPFGVWLALTLLTVGLFWPALWVDPAGALGGVFGEITGNAAQPHNAGNFFRGQPVADPGAMFYLAALRYRIEPATFVGLSALLLISLHQATRRHILRTPAALSPDPARSEERRVLLVLIIYVALFTLCISLLAKKFDRYLLPTWPALQIMAALGLTACYDWWQRTAEQRVRWAHVLIGGLAIGWLGVSLIGPTLMYAPYYLAYYNPILGGGVAAQNVLLVGWGEGMDQVGRWLRTRPDLARGPVLSWLPDTLTPFVPANIAVYDLDYEHLQEPANYAVVYTSVAVRDAQSGAEAFAQQTPPLATIRIRGITYATIHQIPRPFTQAVGAVFGEMHLRGFTQSIADDTLTFTPAWDVRADRPADVFSFIHILDSAGQRIAQFDTRIDDGLYSAWQTGQQFGSPQPIELPRDAPPGRYRVTLGLYQSATGERLPLVFGEALPAEINGPHTIELFSLISDGTTWRAE